MEGVFFNSSVCAKKFFKYIACPVLRTKEASGCAISCHKVGQTIIICAVTGFGPLTGLCEQEV